MGTSVDGAKLVGNIHGPVYSAYKVFPRKKHGVAKGTGHQKSFFCSFISFLLKPFPFPFSLVSLSVYIEVKQPDYKNQE